MMINSNACIINGNMPSVSVVGVVKQSFILLGFILNVMKFMFYEQNILIENKVGHVLVLM